MLILLGLGVLWAAVLVPPLLRSRTAPTGSSGVVAGGSTQIDIYNPRGRFRLGSSPPRSASAARRRRRDVLLVLIGSSVFTLLGGLAVGGLVPWTFHFLTDVALVGYMALLLQRGQAASETSAVVLPMRSSMDHPGLVKDPEEEVLAGGMAN